MTTQTAKRNIVHRDQNGKEMKRLRTEVMPIEEPVPLSEIPNLTADVVIAAAKKISKPTSFKEKQKRLTAWKKFMKEAGLMR